MDTQSGPAPDRFRKGKRLLELLWVLPIALMFGGAGLSLILRSSETADAILGIFLAGLAGLAIYWVFRRYKSRTME